jgi:hypothetical protein
MDIGWIGAVTGPVSLVTGTVSLFVAWRGYRISRKNARRDEARWHDQRTPDLTVESSIEPGGATVISFVTHNPAGLDRVTVTLLTEPGERSPVTGLSQTMNDEPSIMKAVGPLKLGEPVKLGVWQNGRIAGYVLRLRCVCEVAGERPWPLYRECRLPAEHP